MHALACALDARGQLIVLERMSSGSLSLWERVRVRGFRAVRQATKPLTPRPLPQGEGATPGYRWVAGLVGLLLMSCTALMPAPLLPSPLPTLGTLSPAERAQVIQSRTTGLQTLTAVLTVAYSVGNQRGTFDMVVNYAAPETLRFTAFKDALLSTQVLFDLLLTGETYRLYIRDDAGERTYQGTGQQFAHEHPSLRTFFLLGEAFFLPGFDAQGQPPRGNATGTRLMTRLRSGVSAHWFARADTLEILRACFQWQTAVATVPLAMRYQDYRQVGAYYIPHRVTVLDRRLRFTAQSVVKEVEINVPLAPEAFDTISEHEGPR